MSATPNVWALTNLWLSTGDLARARDEAELFVANACGDASAANRHRQTSRDIVLRLATSLEPDDALCQTFLAAPAVATLFIVRSARRLRSGAPFRSS